MVLTKKKIPLSFIKRGRERESVCVYVLIDRKLKEVQKKISGSQIIQTSLKRNDESLKLTESRCSILCVAIIKIVHIFAFISISLTHSLPGRPSLPPSCIT